MTLMLQREALNLAPDDSRKQLGAFLRARRALTRSVRPAARRAAADAGAAPGRGGDAGGRRRDWHRLEQGREVNPSAVLRWPARCSAARWKPAICSVLAGLTPPENTQATVCEGSVPEPDACLIA